MGKCNKLPPLETAEKFIELHFANCQGAILAGSVIRGEATETSDLDIVVFDDTVTSAYRESLVLFEWPIELFVHSLTSYQDFFQSDYKRARPSLARMVSEGIVIKDNGIIGSVKKEATQLLAKGPEQWSRQTITMKRYFITDALDDFIGSCDKAEDIFIANALAEALQEFVLRTNGHWIGASKWVVRSLKHFDEQFAKEYIEAFSVFYKLGNKIKVVQLVDKVLEPYGGRLFDGFSVGKQ